MALKKIIKAGDPRLKAKNKKVTDIASAKVQKLIKTLIVSMHKADLIGIAAPQIGENYQIFITEPRGTKARKSGPKDKIRVYINPKFTYKSKDRSIIYEGCGSIGELFGPVSRPKEVEIEATDQNCRKFTLRADGLLARVIQHEMDHLEGIEFIQKVTDYNKVIVYEHYKKQIRNSPEQKKNSKITKTEYKLL